MSRKAGKPRRHLARLWALPIQQRHFKTVSQASKTLAAEEDPNEPS